MFGLAELQPALHQYQKRGTPALLHGADTQQLWTSWMGSRVMDQRQIILDQVAKHHRQPCI